MNSDIAEFKVAVDKLIAHLKEELKSIRTGRASASLVENLVVEAYGGQSKLRLLELASIMTEGPIQLVISPFDPSTTQDIEKAILKSPIGLSPAVQGSRIIIKIPPLSQEQRDKYIKLAGSMIEEKKMMTRNARDETRKKFKNQFEKKEISEDEKFRYEKELDTITQSYMQNIEQIKENKEKEISEV